MSAEQEDQPRELWSIVMDKYNGDYDAAVKFICVLREVVCEADPSRGENVTNAIRRAKYEEAMQEAVNFE